LGIGFRTLRLPGIAQFGARAILFPYIEELFGRLSDLVKKDKTSGRNRIARLGVFPRCHSAAQACKVFSATSFFLGPGYKAGRTMRRADGEGHLGQVPPSAGHNRGYRSTLSVG
jgi:hypothetical protein